MKNFICVSTLILSLAIYANAQNCSDGSDPEMVVLNLAGLDSSGAIGSSGNSSGTICFPGG